MGVMNFIKRGVQELMIARPDEAKQYAIYKHPDQTIPNHAQLTVDSDEVAIFFKDGKVEGKVTPGRHTLSSQNIPFLSNLVDSFTGANVFISEVFFISTRQFAGIKFGGRIGSVEDPKSGVPVETMVHGDFALQIVNPEALILGLTGMQQTDNESFFSWFKQQVLKVIRDQTAELIVKQGWPLLDVVSGAYTEEIEATVLEGVKKYVDHYGVKIVQLGNFVLGIKEEDEKKLKDLYTDAAYVRMAGGMQGFQQFASGKAMMGAGEGMAQGGGAGGDGNAMLGGAALGVGFGMANMFQQQGAAAPQSGLPPANQGHLDGASGQATAATQGVVCGACQKTVSPGKFCAECGQPLPTGPKFCGNCGNKLGAGAKFCPECGTKTE
ncbi:MAG: SPFH domain-containing protein [Deltaproteobacteria bacterium]|nr:SPFH domain-containing protein [Deltaproteobacteria bacterium]MBN2671799.1 SPFH domain-containing protein [Deltaproteobacteria bacterium]